MNIKTTLTIGTLTATLMLAACGGGADVAKGPNSEARTTAFKAMMPNFSSMGKMVKGEEPYEVEKFKTAAAAFTEESKKPFEHFQQDPEGNGDALPAVWERPDDFKAAEDKFHTAVSELNTAAQSGNLEEIKVAYGNAGASCKACHDTFRRPK